MSSLALAYELESDAAPAAAIVEAHDVWRRYGSGDNAVDAVRGVSLSVAGDQQSALEVLKAQPYVREAGSEDGQVVLYVDRGEVAMPAILRVLDSAGLQLKTIELHRPSLDDVFLRKTGRSLRETAA